MNARIYECCARLTDVERKRDTGAFFRSIHGTLNHLLVGDSVWMARFSGRSFAIQSLDQELYADFDELRAQRIAMDAAIVDWSSQLDATTLSGVLAYVPIAGGKERSLPLAFALAHFINHQTHHRGQVTTLLSQYGIDPGVTDLVAFPECVAMATDRH